MAELQSSNCTNAQNATRSPKQANQPQASKKDVKVDKRGSNKYSSPNHKLRSADPLPEDTDTARIQVLLKSGGTAADIAEEGYRVCRLNAALRRNLERANSELLSPLSDDNDAARISNRVNDGARMEDIAEEAYRVCRINHHLRKKANKTQTELREAKQKIAIKDDVLSEIRPEHREMRTMLQRAWGLLQNKNVRIPEDMTKAYASIMSPDLHDWQLRKHSKKATINGKQDKNESQTTANCKSKGKEVAKGTKQQKKKHGDKGKEEKDEKQGRPEKVNFLLHTQNGKTYNLAVPLGDQDSEASDTDEESEPAAEAEKQTSQPSKKRKATSTDESGSKKRRIEETSKEAEAEVLDKDKDPEAEAIPQPSKKRKGSDMEAPMAKKIRVEHDSEPEPELEEGDIDKGLEEGEIEE
ncbi:hypothetical protein BDU57DRAFT_579531 [Ampelomyces quisqualis]|uniref:Uncharacterized protein n=1 Tax=Ampelomyces quisqualis TaxID=50730 RepID=A0A6A5QH70_AMPQU|nr:hypothetical protein BDU57DRAFT_579531 [Ampelomyces quisqualis]